jgi:Flp pilus assembly pilin Flp
MRVSGTVRRFVEDTSGQDIIEYALLAAFISIVALTVIQTIGLDVSSMYDVIGAQTSAAAAAAS